MDLTQSRVRARDAPTPARDGASSSSDDDDGNHEADARVAIAQKIKASPELYEPILLRKKVDVNAIALACGADPKTVKAYLDDEGPGPNVRRGGADAGARRGRRSPRREGPVLFNLRFARPVRSYVRERALKASRRSVRSKIRVAHFIPEQEERAGGDYRAACVRRTRSLAAREGPQRPAAQTIRTRRQTPLRRRVARNAFDRRATSESGVLVLTTAGAPSDGQRRLLDRLQGADAAPRRVRSSAGFPFQAVSMPGAVRTTPASARWRARPSARLAPPSRDALDPRARPTATTSKYWGVSWNKSTDGGTRNTPTRTARRASSTSSIQEAPRTPSTRRSGLSRQRPTSAPHEPGRRRAARARAERAPRPKRKRRREESAALLRGSAPKARRRRPPRARRARTSTAAAASPVAPSASPPKTKTRLRHEAQ